MTLRILPILAAGLSLATVSSAASFYSVVDIGPVAKVIDFNNRGEVLASDPSGNPFVYRHGRATLIPQPPGGHFRPGALNDRGEVVGEVTYLNYEYYLGIYNIETKNLRIVTEVSGVSPVAVNDRGQIAGDLVRLYKSFLYSDGRLKTITPSEFNLAAVRGMNRKGEVVGVADMGGSRFGFLYSDGRFSTITD